MVEFLAKVFVDKLDGDALLFVEAEDVEDEFVGAEEAEEGVFLVLELVDKVFVDKLDGDALLFVEAEFEDMVTWFDFNLILRFVAS